MKPIFVLLAGPNGSGKSTLAKTLKFQSLGLEMLNPDDIAKLAPQGSNSLIWSGREIHRLIDDKIESKVSFAVETTLSGNNHFKTITLCKAADFYTAMHFVFVENVTTAMGRVRERVIWGGHDVPEEDQLRRFQRSFENAIKMIALVDEAHFYNNSDTVPHQRIAQYLKGKPTYIADNAPDWLRRE